MPLQLNFFVSSEFKFPLFDTCSILEIVNLHHVYSSAVHKRLYKDFKIMKYILKDLQLMDETKG